ncbi:hypothetical protein KFU94_07680 [Chloroflexi bacterium TSY]|nr:hypothetical protein [Chloroflexi bacterium TSY]
MPNPYCSFHGKGLRQSLTEASQRVKRPELPAMSELPTWQMYDQVVASNSEPYGSLF